MKTDLELVQRVLDAFVEEIQHPTKVDTFILESPIEEIFLRELEKVVNDETRIRGQYEAQTQIGRFRLDFVAECPAIGLKIGIECDGRNFHSADSDSERDAAIVAAGVVDKVYRLRGRDIYFRIHDLLELLAFCEPGLFSKRGLKKLRCLAHPAHLLEDWKGQSGRYFPFMAFREYYKPDAESFIDARVEDFGPYQPAVLFWT